MTEQKPLLAPKEPFSHLFPPTAEAAVGATPATVTNNEPALKPSSLTQTSTSSGSCIASSNAGIDYVIVFRFPTKIPTGNKTITTRAELQSYVTESLTSITNRLTKVNLRFQVRAGKEEGTLLILVSSPVGPIKKEYRQER
jgi:anoctamin-10